MIARLRAALQTNKILQYIAIQSRIKSIPKQKIPIRPSLLPILSGMYTPHLPPVHDPQTRNTHTKQPRHPPPSRSRNTNADPNPCILSLRWTSPLGSQTGVVAGRGSVANVCGRWICGCLSLLLLSSILSILSNCRCCVVVVLIARSAFFLACFEFRSSLSFLSAYAGSYVLLSLPL